MDIFYLSLASNKDPLFYCDFLLLIELTFTGKERKVLHMETHLLFKYETAVTFS